MKRVAIVLAILAVSLLAVAWSRGTVPHISLAPPAAGPSARPTAAPRAQRKPTAARPAMHEVRFSRYRFQVPANWMQANPGNGHEMAFGSTDGRLGVTMMLVPRQHLAGYLRTRADNPLPGTPARLIQTHATKRVINGLPADVSSGIIRYGEGKTYEVRFWVYHGQGAALVVNAFDGVKAHARTLDAVAGSVRQASRRSALRQGVDFWAAMPAVARRLVGARTTD